MHDDRVIGDRIEHLAKGPAFDDGQAVLDGLALGEGREQILWGLAGFEQILAGAYPRLHVL